jgi:DNA-binding transcriptional regulator YiaG
MISDKKYVKDTRKKLRMTQQEFADVMEVEKGTVSRWERGVQSPKPLHLRRMDNLNKKGK